MQGWDFPYRQGVEDVLALLRGQWTVAVLAALALGEKRRKDLLPAINGIDDRAGRAIHTRPLTDRVLEDTLQRAHDDGLIEKRTEGADFGAATWWRLTPTGSSLLGALRPLAEWAQENRYARQRQIDDAAAP
jgi:DNA-binding HxlR family transcriptional regulator